MTRSDRMQPIKAVADGRERDAGALVARARQALDDAERQLAQLEAYRAEYAGRASTGAAPDPVRLQNWHAFVARLDDAVRRQRDVVAAARVELERRTAEWRERRVEASSLGRVVDRLEAHERRAEDRREQLEADERALRTRPPRE